MTPSAPGMEAGTDAQAIAPPPTSATEQAIAATANFFETCLVAMFIAVPLSCCRDAGIGFAEAASYGEYRRSFYKPVARCRGICDLQPRRPGTGPTTRRQRRAADRGCVRLPDEAQRTSRHPDQEQSTLACTTTPGDTPVTRPASLSL